MYFDRYLDFMNIMTYDFHGDWEKNVNHNSPLFALNSASSYQKKLTVVSVGGKAGKLMVDNGRQSARR